MLTPTDNLESPISLKHPKEIYASQEKHANLTLGPCSQHVPAQKPCYESIMLNHHTIVFS